MGAGTLFSQSWANIMEAGCWYQLAWPTSYEMIWLNLGGKRVQIIFWDTIMQDTLGKIGQNSRPSGCAVLWWAGSVPCLLPAYFEVWIWSSTDRRRFNLHGGSHQREKQTIIRSSSASHGSLSPDHSKLIFAWVIRSKKLGISFRPWSSFISSI